MTSLIGAIGLGAYQPGVIATIRSVRALDGAARVVALHPRDRPYGAHHRGLIEGAGGRTHALDFSACAPRWPRDALSAASARRGGASPEGGPSRRP